MKAKGFGAFSIFLSLLFATGCLESNPQPAPSTTGTVDEGEGGAGRRNKGGDGEVPLQDPADVRVDSKLPPGLDYGAADGVSEHAEDAASDIAGLFDAIWPEDCWETAATDLDVAGEVDLLDGDDTVEEMETQELPVECEPCEPPYPGCAQIQGQWECVQCTEDSHCGEGCTCNLAIFGCAGCAPPPPDDCSSDEECAELKPGLVCEPDGAFCRDPSGWCDDEIAFCNADAGSECVALIDFPDQPGLPGGADGLCTCDDPIDPMDLATCLMGNCPESEMCYPGQVCMELQMICQFLLGDCPPVIDEALCVSPTMLPLDELFP